MKCPFCGNSSSQVLESRTVEGGSSIRRRRKCEHCEKRFTTYEKTRNSVLWVIKKDGKREPFERDKVKRGILRAIEKRPVSLDLVDEIVGRVEREMLRKDKAEVPSRAIGTAIMRKLKKVDKVAWLRFASVYMEFEDLDDFEKAITKISE
ncbi:transcriptional regulator NrdR [Candidatus Woesebacteria bacterium RIFCSPHIGHO2_01_FULL_44_21]|uniref:Transcriptional repressor NrdR n=1 Tax=Candidatus Woesebacteria bacterium RIFCSPHIGHO2_01_FULL_44_21 TaxID=1802503 RepID=A0A1F7YYT5_9BACT|nr:MAG: transcriptional regulator NrdR [Candidatus Woesebacteria bacterium RIFCSPHIGHO2_01_FULL_44_21]OGM69170.1 MAG: transcriptional regulator NrdR [Candidatus Woesebacteria bacterium RIFCSPLOWO2_01_FULL_44_24b]